MTEATVREDLSQWTEGQSCTDPIFILGIMPGVGLIFSSTCCVSIPTATALQAE